MYRTIRAVAYEPDPAHGAWQVPLQVLRLGDDLHSELVRRRRQVGRADGPARLPVYRLNSLLRATVPGVLATGRNAGVDGQLPWLYAREVVPQEVLAPVLGTWAAGLVGSDDGDDEELEDELLADTGGAAVSLPSWETECVDLTETVISAGGTAEPLQRLYNLLPEAIAFRLVGSPYRTRGALLHFRVVSSGNGVELVSWPPQQYERRGRTWYYSACLTITVQTVPFAPRFRVHVATGVRRWATCLDVVPRALNGATVLLDAPLPWSGGRGRGYRIAENTLGFDRQAKQLVWRRRSPALLLPELDIVRQYPEPAELFESPEKWLLGQRGLAAGIVYHPVLGPHEVAPGLMPRERAELDAWVEERLQPVLRRVGDLARVTRHNTPSLLPRSAKATEPDTREARKAMLRRTALARALDGRPLDVEIVWQTPQTRDALLAALPEVVGLPPGSGVDADGSRQWQVDGIQIRVWARPAEGLAQPLRIAGNRKRRRAVRLAEAIADRCALVAGSAGPPSADVGIVIAEIAGKDRFAAAPDSDPKHALRLSWARQGRLVQFVNLPGDDRAGLEHRAKWTWLDAFRQLGAISPPAHRVGAGIPGDLQYAALWLVRYTRKGPTRCPARRIVAVRMRPGAEAGAVEGWDAERAAWVPYPELLLALANSSHDAAEQPGQTNREDSGQGTERQWLAEAERQIREVLFQLRERPTLLMASAGNLRQCWPRLRNGALTRDMLGFGDAPDQRITVYGPGLRVVLVRDANGRGEVADWYAHESFEKVGFSEGVWASEAPDNRVFASTASRPHTAAGVSKDLMKLVPTAECRTAPGRVAWNPAMLEVTVLGCLSSQALADAGRADATADRPAEWATLTHQLRYHDDYPPLARPLPLHLARLAGEYVLPLATDDEGASRTTPKPTR
ncbi:pPIWI_RE module domain-containing protein [Kitasatospora sp. NPDC018619]|uniref:pPIWI_RE module domain-containing protein n=1 Tax=unclassified Kitasatospora TaxID=2633591 RepID=UPI0037B46F56